jgi:tRNA A37 threonylcarbamoyladenosine modification protein TsaB
MNYTVLIVSIASPLIIGLYDNNKKLIKSIESQEKTSDSLLKILMDLKKDYNYNHIIYTNGPGSYMSIKITYITLATLEIVDGIKFSACDAFCLNGNNPIKAMGKIYFIKEKENIITKKIDEAVEQRFYLPNSLEDIKILDDNRPMYILPAI